MRKLTIPEAAASTNICFKVETEEQQRMFQEEFFRQGGVLEFGVIEVRTSWKVRAFLVTDKILVTSCYIDPEVWTHERVEILWQQPSIEVASLAPETTLQFTLNSSLNWQATLALLTELKNEELAKEFITDKCLRKLSDEQLASLAKFLLEKTEGYCKEEEEVVKSFVLTTKNYLTKRTKQLEYWYKFYRKEVEHIVRQSQAGLYQEELKESPEWEGLSWEWRGEE